MQGSVGAKLNRRRTVTMGALLRDRGTVLTPRVASPDTDSDRCARRGLPRFSDESGCPRRPASMTSVAGCMASSGNGVDRPSSRRACVARASDSVNGPYRTRGET